MKQLSWKQHTKMQFMRGNNEWKKKKKATSWSGLQTWEEWFAVRVGAAGFLCGSPPVPCPGSRLLFWGDARGWAGEGLPTALHLLQGVCAGQECVKPLRQIWELYRCVKGHVGQRAGSIGQGHDAALFAGQFCSWRTCWLVLGVLAAPRGCCRTCKALGVLFRRFLYVTISWPTNKWERVGVKWKSTRNFRHTLHLHLGRYWTSLCNALLAVSVAQKVAREFALDLQPGLGVVTALALASTSHPLHDQELHMSCHRLKGLLQNASCFWRCCLEQKPELLDLNELAMNSSLG